MLDILMTNKDALLEALNGFRDELDRLEDLIHRENWEQLASELDQASDQYRLFTGGVS
jgi:prephenate dehydrogenase